MSTPTKAAEIREALEAAQIAIDGAHAGQHSFLPGQYRDWKNAKYDWTTATKPFRP